MTDVGYLERIFLVTDKTDSFFTVDELFLTSVEKDQSNKALDTIVFIDEREKIELLGDLLVEDLSVKDMTYSEAISFVQEKNHLGYSVIYGKKNQKFLLDTFFINRR